MPVKSLRVHLGLKGDIRILFVFLSYSHAHSHGPVLFCVSLAPSTGCSCPLHPLPHASLLSTCLPISRRPSRPPRCTRYSQDTSLAVRSPPTAGLGTVCWHNNYTNLQKLHLASHCSDNLDMPLVRTLTWSPVPVALMAMLFSPC